MNESLRGLMADMAPPCSVAPACLPPSRRRLCAEKRGRPARRACFHRLRCRRQSARFSGAMSMSTLRTCYVRTGAGSSKRGGGRGGRRASLPRAPAPSSPKLAGPGAEQPPQKNGTGRITALASRDNANECHCQLNRSHLHLASPFTHHKRSRKSHPQGAAPAAEARRAALRVHRHRQVGEHALVAATSTTAA